MSQDNDFDRWLFDDDLSAADTVLDDLIRLETERQARQIILIPSESRCMAPVRKALDSSFTNLYAEGYPPSASTNKTLEELTDQPRMLAHYRRYADRRFYKGNAYVDLVESICRRRVAECFANDRVPADRIFELRNCSHARRRPASAHPALPQLAPGSAA